MIPLQRHPRYSPTKTTKPGGRILPGFVVGILFLLALPGPLCADNAERMVEQAMQAELAAKPYWQTLLHYRPSWRGTGSLIDDPDFFLAEDGKTDPQAELEATIRGFFQPVGSDPDQHPRCRFPARFNWLDQALGLNRSLPDLVCPRFEKVKAEIQPRSAELIFPGSNFNNPASMFGHTLININGPYRSKLLSHALNYSAVTREKNGFAYAVKGIFGFYKGYYSTLPYYAKLKQYNDLERRDIWEYELDFSADEMERMFRHIWELEEIYSDYYFFDENCAFQLLFLFDAARPSLELVDRTRPWVIPVDTVRLLDDAGVVVAAEYRPSKATRIAWNVSHMSEAEKDFARQLLEGKRPPEDLSASAMDSAARVRILDLAIETIEFRYLSHEIERPEYRRRYLALLQQRSYIKPETRPVPEIPVPVRPDRGHGSNRFSLQGGEWRKRSFVELSYRPAYHDLLDDNDGYLAGSQINFANVDLRYYDEEDQLRLHQLDLVSIVSLTPRHRFYRPISWKLEAGFSRQVFESDRDRLLFRVNPGGGFTYGDEQIMLYLLVETDARLSRHFRDKYMLGFGGSGGLLAELGGRIKLKLDIRQIGFLYGDEPYREFEATAGFNWTLGTDSSFVVEAKREKTHDIYGTEVKAGFNFYW